MANPKISFIIPAYNTRDYISQTLNSLRSDRSDEYEVIVVHDGGSDDTLQVVQNWMKKYPEIGLVVIDQPNAGPSAARHTGVNHAKGKYLAFCDSDDFIDIHVYLHMLDVAERHACEIVMCRSVVFDSLSGGNHDFYDANIFDSIIGNQAMVVTSWARHPQLFSLEPNANTRIIQREFFLSVPLEFQRGKHYEDLFPHVVGLSQARHVGLVNRTGFFYRVGRPGAITTETGMRRFDVLSGVKHALEAAEKAGLPTAARASILSMVVRMVFWCGQYIPISEQKRYVREAESIIKAFVTDEIIKSGVLDYFRTQREAFLAMAFQQGETLLIEQRTVGQRTLNAWHVVRFLLRNRKTIKTTFKRLGAGR